MSDITAIPSASAVQIASNAIRKSQTELRKDASVVANPSDVEMRDTVDAMVDSRSSCSTPRPLRSSSALPMR